MLEKIEFPEGISYTLQYIASVGDYWGSTFQPISTTSLYSGFNQLTSIRINYDTSNVTSMSYMFNNCSNLITIPQLDTCSVTSMNSMFNGCSSLTSIPQLDTSSVTDMGIMFYGCSNLITIPQLDTSNVTNMTQFLRNCSSLNYIPRLDVSKATTVSYMLDGCSKLISIPDFNCVKLTNFGSSSSSSWLRGCSKLQSIGVIDCDSITNIGYALGNTTNNNLTHLGGFRNLGKASSVSNTNSSYFLTYAPNLTYESVLNVLNGLYDRASAGLSILTLKMHANHLAMLSEDDIAIATNKGWTIV